MSNYPTIYFDISYDIPDDLEGYICEKTFDEETNLTVFYTTIENNNECLLTTQFLMEETGIDYDYVYAHLLQAENKDEFISHLVHPLLRFRAQYDIKNMYDNNRYNNDSCSTCGNQSSAPAPKLIRIASNKNRSALRLAELSHRGVQRKGDPYAYLTHVATVADIMAGAGGDRNHVVACYLHDVVEDTAHLPKLPKGSKDKDGNYIPRYVSIKEIEEEFGSTVAKYVTAVTKTEEKNIPLEQQADFIIKKLKKVGDGALAVKACDLLSNISDLVFDVEEKGLIFFDDLYGENRAIKKVNHYIKLIKLINQELEAYPRWHRLIEALDHRLQELEILIHEHTTAKITN